MKKVDAFNPENLTLSDELASLKVKKWKKRVRRVPFSGELESLLAGRRERQRCSVQSKWKPVKSAGMEIAGPFIPPIPVEAFEAAAKLPGHALAVFMVTWRECRLEGTWTITLTNKRLTKVGVTRQSKTRALAALERAGLIKVKRSNNRSPVVTVVVHYRVKVRKAPITLKHEGV